MAERDRFELDLAASLRDYAEDAPTQVRPTELARHFATAYPHGTATLGPWRFAAIPRLAWVLLLGAALLAALISGALLVGSQPQRRLPAVVPPVGQVYECPPGSNPDEPGPVDQARPADHFAETIVFDRRAGRLVAVMGGDPEETAPATWTFDVCTNTWTQMHPDREPPESISDQLVYDVDSDATIGIASGNVWVYDLKANTWTEKGVAPPPGSGFRVYDPVSGLVVAGGDEGLWSYDVETDTWALIHQANGPPWGWGLFAYDASVDRLVMYTGRDYAAGDVGHDMWLLDLRTGTWSRSGAEAPSFFMGLWGLPPVWAYDEATERTVFSSPWRLAAYDATADRWEILVEVDPGGPSLYHPMAYDPLHRRFVGWDQELPGTTVALDPVTREWVLLDRDPKAGPWPRPTPAPTPGERQPANTPAATPAPTSARMATPSGETEATDSASPVSTASPTPSP